MASSGSPAPDAPLHWIALASQSARLRTSAMMSRLRCRRNLDDVTGGNPLLSFVIVVSGNPLTWPGRSRGRAFFRVSSDLRHQLVPDVVVALPVGDISRLHAEADSDRADVLDTDRRAGDGTPDRAHRRWLADLARSWRAAHHPGEPAHGVAAFSDQLADQRPVRLAHRE